jgi:hypothetical protein
MNPRGANFLIETATIRQAHQADAAAFERISSIDYKAGAFTLCACAWWGI